MSDRRSLMLEFPLGTKVTPNRSGQQRLGYGPERTAIVRGHSRNGESLWLQVEGNSCKEPFPRCFWEKAASDCLRGQSEQTAESVSGNNFNFVDALRNTPGYGQPSNQVLDWFKAYRRDIVNALGIAARSESTDQKLAASDEANAVLRERIDQAVKRMHAAESALATARKERDEAREALRFQDRVGEWMQACFGPEISKDKIERNHRFLEEALELVQSNGCTQHEAIQLVEYVYGRPVGDPNQECGGVMVTLAALCLASGMEMKSAGETELDRVWAKIDRIREKQAAKPKHSPLAAFAPPPPAGGREGE